MNAPAPVVRDFKPFERNILKRNILRGFFDVELASGLILRGYCLHEKNGNFWCGPPAKPYEDKDGKQTWAAIIDFRDKQTGYRFQQIVIPLAVEAFERAKVAA